MGTNVAACPLVAEVADRAPREVDIFRLWVVRLALLLPAFIAASSASFYLAVRHHYVRDWERNAVNVATNLNRDLIAELGRRPGHVIDPEQWQADGSVREVDRIARRYLRYLDVDRINIFGMNRWLVYSTHPGLAPRASGANRKLDRALAGQAVSDIERTEDVTDFAEGRHGQDVLETYVPLRVLDGTGPILGAFEVYQRVGAMQGGLRSIAWLIAVGSAGILGLLGIWLLATARRASRLVDEERREQQRLKADLRQTVEHLEEIVAERTTEVRREREMLATVLDAAPSAIILLDEEGRLIYASRRYSDFSDTNTAPAAGRLCWEACGCFAEAERCPARRALLTGTRQSALRSFASRGAGQLWLEHTAVPVQRGDGKVGVLEMIVDVSARREAEEHLSRAARLATAGEVAATVAHEIRNAATSTKLLLQVWAQGPDRPADAQSIQVALSSIGRMESLVGHLLRLARPVRPRLAALDACAVLRDAVDLVRPEAHRRGVLVVETNRTAGLRCLADGALLTEALVNLLLNALQAFEEGGDRRPREVSVEARIDASAASGARACVVIEIADNGSGVPPEVVDRMFEPFFTTKPSGTGLGLPIARRVAATHGGSLTIENRTDGGTLARLSLPALEGQA